MSFEISLVVGIFGLIVGFILAWKICSNQKWSDKADALNEKWKRENVELNSAWELRYTKDMSELKSSFKNAEKIIRLNSVSSSRRTLVGKFIEKFVPFLSKIPFVPSDMHFLGQPIDYIVFDGLHQDNVEKIIFLEVKTGKSKLNKREKSLKDAVEKKKIYWKEYRIDTSEEKTPDKEMENENSVINELYEDIDNKIKNVKMKSETESEEM